MKNVSIYIAILILSLSSAVFSEPSVRLITDSTGINDKSFNSAAWDGILKFYGDKSVGSKKKGRQYDAISAPSQDQYVSYIKNVSNEKYDLIIVTGFTFADALIEIAPQYPNQKYLIVDVDWVNKSNVSEAVFAEHEGSYLVGLAAALKAKADGIVNPKFGFIGGVPGSVITKFEVGYIQGILSILPQASFIDYYANSWNTPEYAKTQARNWYLSQNIYCIFSAAGFTGSGTIAMAKELRSQGKNVWAIGVDSDQYSDGIFSTKPEQSAVLTSMLKRVDIAAYSTIENISKSIFKSGPILFDVKSGGVDFSKRNRQLDENIVNQIELAKNQIANGKIKIAKTFKDAKLIRGFPDKLQAKDD